MEILGLILPLFGLIIIGYVAAKITKQPVEALGWLSTFIVYIALPALFYKLLSRTPIDQLASWNFIGVNIGVTFCIFALTFAIGYFATRGNIPEATVQGFAGAYGNIGYMGPALAILVFGERAAIPVAIIFCFENAMHFTLAPALMAIGGQAEGGPLAVAQRVVVKIVTHPFMIASAVGVGAAFFHFSEPAPVTRLIDYLAQAAAPCALFAMGVTLALRPLKRVPLALGYVVPMKLILHPFAMYLVLAITGVASDNVWLFTAVLLAALPTATNVFVIAQQYNAWVERASASVLVSTVVSIVTVSLLIYAVKEGMLPAQLF